MITKRPLIIIDLIVSKVHLENRRKPLCPQAIESSIKMMEKTITKSKPKRSRMADNNENENKSL